MRNCFIPRCDQICRELGETKRAMFAAPKDKETFEAWMAVLPQVRPFKAHDKICERHFEHKWIKTTYDNVINGKIYQMERGRPRLKPKAVPSINLDLHLHLPKPPSNKRNKARTSIAPVELVEEEMKETDINSYQEQHIEEVAADDVQKVTEATQSTTVAFEIQPEQMYAAEAVEVSATHILELFDSLYDDIYEIVLPNTLWGVHRCPQRSSIFFSYVDPKVLRTTKMISANCQGQVQILLGSRLQSEQSLVTDIATIEALSLMISEIDEVKLCPRLFLNESCEVTLTNLSEICESCEQNEPN